MAKLDVSYEPHLTLMDLQIAEGAEWAPRFRGWSVIQLHAGAGYWLSPGSNLELSPGSVLIVAEGIDGTIRASQLSPATLRYFRVEPERLTGLMTLTEQRFFETAAIRRDLAARVCDGQSRIALELHGMRAAEEPNTVRTRLQLLALFFESFGESVMSDRVEPELPTSARKRLRDFLDGAPVADLLELEFSSLAERLCCTPRHLGRVFQETVGMSFRDKQTEVRLARARELLATTESKILDVALESGYQSISLFNALFKRSHGMTPGQWRKKTRGQKLSRPRPRLQF
jgi:AraC-like DNA-binding protein